MASPLSHWLSTPLRGVSAQPPLTHHYKDALDSSELVAGIRRHRQGDEDVGAHSANRLIHCSIGRSVQMLLTLASCPVEGCPISRPFQGHNPRPPSCVLTRIPVQGYGRASRPFPPVAPIGWPRDSSQTRHGVSTHCSSHSMAIRPTLTTRRGIARSRQREQ